MKAPLHDPYDGVLLVDKPSGFTSHDVVDRIRRHFRFRKVGHGGTLDPQATGLLVILLGRGTKLSGQMLSSDKTYEGTMHLGVATDTQDLDGHIIREADYHAVTRAMLEAEMQRRSGDQMQTPPMMSAVKKDGVPLYKLARRGETVAREPKLIHIYEFRLKDFDPPRVTFLLRCSKGTYVRTLCHEIGEALGCGAYLASLRRTQSGPFTVDQTISMPQLLAYDPLLLLNVIIPLYRCQEFLRQDRPVAPPLKLVSTHESLHSSHGLGPGTAADLSGRRLFRWRASRTSAGACRRLARGADPTGPSLGTDLP
jgi:tRNA pseudouridine55 synthase